MDRDTGSNTSHPGAMLRTRWLPHALALLATACLAGGCASVGGSRGDSANAGARPAATTTTAAVPAASGTASAGMNARGEVVDSAKVEAGSGQKVKGINDWEGEITGKPAPGSKFGQLRIGMDMAQATAIVGQPSDRGTRMSGTMFNPFYFGADKYKRELVFKGMGRLVFGERGGFGSNDGGNLIWIIHNANESATR